MSVILALECAGTKWVTGRGLGSGHAISACALERTAAAPASANSARARSTAPRIAERAQFRWMFPKCEPHSLPEHPLELICRLPWNQSRRNDTCALLLCDAGRGDTTGRAGSDLRSVCTRHATARATLQQRQGTCGRGQRQEFENAQRSPVAGNALLAKSGGEPPPLRTL